MLYKYKPASKSRSAQKGQVGRPRITNLCIAQPPDTQHTTPIPTPLTENISEVYPKVATTKKEEKPFKEKTIEGSKRGGYQK